MGWQPGALVILGARIYIADASTGAILVFEHNESKAQLIGEVDGWRGPVTALAIGAGGDLFIKPGLDDIYYRFTADAAYIKQGKLTAGPFDAGEEREWERAWIDAQSPQGTSLTVNVALKDTIAPPTTKDWIELPRLCLDVLLAKLASGNRRFIWMRLELATSSPQQSPAFTRHERLLRLKICAIICHLRIDARTTLRMGFSAAGSA